MSEQLNKIQIKAEILTIISKLQANIEAAESEELFETLLVQEDKKSILDVLIKELSKAPEQKAVLICFLLLKLCEKDSLESELWQLLKSSSVKDETKAVILNLLKDMGNKVNYENLEEYFEDPDKVVDADTEKLLKSAIINPEAQIDFLDFLNSLPDADKIILVKSLGEDYSSDDLANILSPVALFAPDSELGQTAIEVLGTTKSQLALHALSELLEFVKDEEIVSLVKKNISTLKLAGIREDNSEEFYKSVLNSKPYKSFASYPDGHGNQALIFSREKENGNIQLVAIVISDVYGIVDCFGFNEITLEDFERIIASFYGGDDYIYVDAHVLKTMLLQAEKLTRKNEGSLSYEYICWKALLADIQTEPVPVELILKTQFSPKPLSEEEFNKVCMFDFVQTWFLDTGYNDGFSDFINTLNESFRQNDFNIDFDKTVEENTDVIFSAEYKALLDKRILISAYLMYLSGNKDDSSILYSLYYDEEKKQELTKNILRKSIYEYYVGLKFKYKEEHKMTNIFAMKNKSEKQELTEKQINLAISIIEGLWVNNA